MVLKSYGDKISHGKYICHSKFEKAINFIDPHNQNKTLISLVNEEIGSGPFNIVVERYDRIPAKDILSLEITPDSFLIRSASYWEEVRIEDVQRGKYNSDINQTFENTDIAMKILEDFLLKLAYKNSLVFLLDEKRKNNSNSVFERELITRIQNGVEDLLNSRFNKGIGKLRGAGFGLTPSGDDFLAGVLYALNSVQRLTCLNTKRLINKIYTKARGENPFSNTLLLCAKEGLFFERLKNLIYALITKNHKEIKKSLQSLLKIGQTSGADLAVGFLMVMKRRPKWH
jgi:hypothetical protein